MYDSCISEGIKALKSIKSNGCHKYLALDTHVQTTPRYKGRLLGGFKNKACLLSVLCFGIKEFI